MPDFKKSTRPKKLTQKAVRAARALEVIPHHGLKFSQKHHIFIAKAKRGELWALNHLSVAARGAVTPLFEMWPPAPPQKPKAPEAGKTALKPKSAKSLTAHATDLLQTIRNEWGTLPLFLDTRYVPTGGIPSPTSAKTIFDIARTMQLAAVPVTSLPFAPAYQQEIRDAIAKDGRGVMLRLFITDFISAALLAQYLAGLLNVLQITSGEVDILIDLGYKPNQIEIQQLGGSAISVLPFLNDWRTVTLASGCFPGSISNAESGVWFPVPRVDWLGWLYVNSIQANGGHRLSTYGDYGVRCGGAPLNIPNRPDPNIRYSHKEKILVRKGPKTDGVMKTICASLVARAEFSGTTFSQGDSAIAAKAAMSGSPNNGQAEQWIQWCTNHHLELTASQIQNLP
jgi:T4 beta protein